MKCGPVRRRSTCLLNRRDALDIYTLRIHVYRLPSIFFGNYYSVARYTITYLICHQMQAIIAIILRTEVDYIMSIMMFVILVLCIRSLAAELVLHTPLA